LSQQEAQVVPAEGLQAIRRFAAALVTLSNGQDMNELLFHVVLSACQLVDAEGGTLYLLDHFEQCLHLRAGVFGNTKTFFDGIMPIPLFKNGKPDASTLPGYCVFVDRPAYVPDMYRQTAFDQQSISDYDELSGFRTQSVLALPFRCQGNGTVGALLLANFKNGVKPLPQSVEEIAMIFTSQAAIAVENTRLNTENRKLIDVLHYTNCQLEDENIFLKKRIESRSATPFPEIIGASPVMRRVFHLMNKALGNDATVLLKGETGTGKDVVAVAIHHNSKRKAGPFIAQNCTALPETLLEAELFGYRRGAFTGAITDNKGLIEHANHGTLFLDEIGDMPLPLQAKLLRVLEDRKVRALGSVDGKTVNVRFIAATHRDLQERVKAGLFREDLYYRLAVFPIDMPPLRERNGDIILLLDHYLRRHAKMHGKTITGFSPKALDKLLDYEYPGNVRELGHVLERAVLLCEDQGKILVEHLLLPSDKSVTRRNAKVPTYNHGQTLKAQNEEFETSLIREALHVHRGNQTVTAKALAISRRTLIDKIRKYRL
jgi:sigma-54-dependent transcriptional regulator